MINRNKQPFSRTLSEKDHIRQYYLIYTALFVVVSCIVFCWYFIPGRTFIWRDDGWNQHYKALIYYAQYMRSIASELFTNHRFIFPEWEFAFGEGNDILQTLHYYVIGDPFTLFSLFVPTAYMWVYYDFTILLRLYAAGIAFSALCHYTRKNLNHFSVVAGALSYVFCYWAIYNANRHPYFLNPMIYFPLIILGVEKILRKEKPYILILSVFFAAISNFYYFYNIVILTVIYVTVRLLILHKTNLKSMLNDLLRIAGGSILGTTMGAAIVLPVTFAFLSDTRMSAGNAWHLLYPMSYYSRLVRTFFAGDGTYWLCMGYAAPVILAIFLLFMRKKQHHVLKLCLAICLVIILIPALGQFLNGMSYMSNKWCWAIALLCAYVFTVMWPELMNLNFKEAAKLAVTLSLCFLSLLMLEYSRTTSSFASIGIAFIFLLTIFPVQMETPHQKMLWEKRKQAIALVLVIISLANVSFFKNAASTGNYAAEAVTPEYIEQLMQTNSKAVDEFAEADGTTDFYRYSGRSLTDNAGMLYNISNTQYFWSLSNPAISDFRTAMALRESLPHHFQGYDDRTALNTLSSVKYYVLPKSDNSPVPYGFTYLGNTDVSETDTSLVYQIYRNDNALPISYVYDTILSEEQWDRLSPAEKQEAMLQSVMLTGYDGATQDDAVRYTSQVLDYTIKCNGSGISLQDYGFVVTSANATATVSFDGLPNSETYFSISGLDFAGVTAYKMYFGDDRFDPLDRYSETRWNLLSYADQKSAKRNDFFWTEPSETTLTLKSSTGISKAINYYTEDYRSYNDRHDFTVNLNYTEEAVSSITITFSTVGIYSFDSIEIICQPMENYTEQVAALKTNGLENVQIGTDIVVGDITLDHPQVLCITIPYSDGWTAWVDDEKATLYQANIKNMALILDTGKHTVRLTYHTPYLRIGAMLSALGFLGFFALLLTNRFRKKKLATKE